MAERFNLRELSRYLLMWVSLLNILLFIFNICSPTCMGAEPCALGSHLKKGGIEAARLHMPLVIVPALAVKAPSFTRAMLIP